MLKKFLSEKIDQVLYLFNLYASRKNHHHTDIDDIHETTFNTRKYFLVDTIKIQGQPKKLFRIQAAKDIPLYGIKAGAHGGLVENEDNLSHEGNCWIDFSARASGNSRIKDNALVIRSDIRGDAIIQNDAMVSCSVIENRAIIEENAIVESSSIGKNAVIGGNEFVIHNTPQHQATKFEFIINSLKSSPQIS